MTDNGPQEELLNDTCGVCPHWRRGRPGPPLRRRAPMNHRHLLAIVEHPAAVSALRCYYGGWTGSRFESLGRPDGTDPHPDQITAADIAAVSLLSVTVPAEGAIALLEGDLGRQVAEQLRAIPTDVDLGTAQAFELVRDGSAANRAWHLLTAQHRIGPVLAGTLLARKRPRLIPVHDAVVECAIKPPPHQLWISLNHQLQTNDGLLRNQLRRLHTAARLPEQVSVLRVLGVIVWMFHQRTHAGPNCIGLDLSAVPAGPDCTAWLGPRTQLTAGT
ncbi:DUF6308 family protein [Catellatospora sp. NPDC049133]|uniref:DUF6308 family protein n=1 Tax=Catellatospora sp. NPDC049133 TaxID=3155499 RepID=UPI0033D60295